MNDLLRRGSSRHVGAGLLLLCALMAALSVFAYLTLDGEARVAAASAGLDAAIEARKGSLKDRERLLETASGAGRPGDVDGSRVISLVSVDLATTAGPRVTPIAPLSDYEPFRGSPYRVQLPGGRIAEAYGGYVNLSLGRRMFVGERLDAHRGKVYPALWAILGSGLAIGVALIAYGAWVQRRTDRQLAEIVEALERVSRGDFAKHLTESGRGDEWDQLRVHVNTASLRLQSMIEQLGGLADLVSHELGSAVGRVQRRIERVAGAQDLATAQESARAALVETSRVHEAVRALLELNSIKAGGSHRFVRLDLATVATDVVQMFAATAEDAGQTLQTQLERGEVLGERDLLVQLLTNLVDNAIKYTPSGGRVDVAVQVAGDQVVLSVADTGPGIPKDRRSTMLQPARRLPRDRDKPGFGYGLAVVNAVARRHGGEVQIPDLSSGLRVEVVLPRYVSATQGWPRNSRAIRR